MKTQKKKYIHYLLWLIFWRILETIFNHLKQKSEFYMKFMISYILKKKLMSSMLVRTSWVRTHVRLDRFDIIYVRFNKIILLMMLKISRCCVIRRVGQYREYSIIRQLHLQQKSVGSRKVGLSNNFSMGWYWSGFQKKSKMSKCRIIECRIIEYSLYKAGY